MEALAVIFVFVVSAIIFVATWFGTVNAPRNQLAELGELELYRETLRKKALRAQWERWDDVMTGQIADQLEDVDRRIAKLAGRG